MPSSKGRSYWQYKIASRHMAHIAVLHCAYIREVDRCAPGVGYSHFVPPTWP